MDLSSGRGPDEPRRGFDRFSVVSRWRRDNPPGFDDPFDENALAASATTTVALQYGALRGTIARLVIAACPTGRISTSPWGRGAA